MRPRRRGIEHPGRLAPTAWAALLVLLSAAAPAWAQSSSLELAVKATYLVKFAPFVEWPGNAFESQSSPLVLCIVGAPFGGTVEQAAAGQVVGQHPIVVRHIATAERGLSCHILFTAGTPQQSVDASLTAVRGQPVLTVTDLPVTAAHRGIVNFLLQNNRVRFEIDSGEAAREGLRISSQLLSLAVNANVQ